MRSSYKQLSSHHKAPTANAYHVIVVILSTIVFAEAAAAPATWTIDAPPSVAWRSWLQNRVIWGTSNFSSWQAAASTCRSQGGTLLSIKTTAEHQSLAQALGGALWVGLTSNTSNGQGRWVGGESWSMQEAGQYIGGFWKQGGSPARAAEPWCTGLLYPSLHTFSGAFTALNCTARLPFLCGFATDSTPSNLEAYGTTYQLHTTTALTVGLPLTWWEASTWCKRRGGTLLDLSDDAITTIARDLPLPSPLYPSYPTTASSGTPDARLGLWLGLGADACRYLAFDAGVRCMWDGDVTAKVYDTVAPTGQALSDLVAATQCTVVDPEDMRWKAQVSCLDSRLAICEIDNPITWEGYRAARDGWKYTFFARPADVTTAQGICAQQNGTLIPLGNNAEQAWVAAEAARWARGLPLMMAGAWAGGSCWVMGARHPNDSLVFVPGVVQQVPCGGLQAAFVCRTEISLVHTATADPLLMLAAAPDATRSPTDSPSNGTTTYGAPIPPPDYITQGARPYAPKNTGGSSMTLPTPTILAIAFSIAGAIIVALAAALLLLRRRRAAAAPPGLPFSKSPNPTLIKNPTFRPLDSADTVNASNPIPHGDDPTHPPDTPSHTTLSTFPYSAAASSPPSTPRPAPPTTPDPSHTLHILLDMDPNKDLKLFRDQKLGHGAFGAVYRGEYFGVPVAVKTLDVLSMSGLTTTMASWSSSISSGASAEVAAIKQELEILSRVQHPNVVKLYGGCLTPPNVLIVMELMEYSLAEYIKRAGRRLPLRTTLQVIRAVAAGLTSLHPTIIHRDLKPQNILLDSTGNVKISDFGVSRVKLATYLTTQHQAAGTIPYMAPECYSSEAVTEKFDIYSLGIVLWECITGQSPWHGWNGMAIMYHVGCLKVRPPLPEDPAVCPPDVAALIQRCWSDVPEQRPSASEIVNEINRIESLLPQ